MPRVLLGHFSSAFAVAGFSLIVAGKSNRPAAPRPANHVREVTLMGYRRTTQVFEVSPTVA